MENALNEILEELRGIKFFPFTIPKRDNTREKVCENPNNKIYAFCLGKARQYNRKYLVDCARNKRYSKLLTKLRTAIKLFNPDFKYTSIQINKNVKCKTHRDKNNVGASVALSLGDFTGGGIIQYNLDGTEKFIDTHNCFKYQDGDIPHTTAEFTGERYALIFYYHSFGIYPKGEILREELDYFKYHHIL